MSAHPKSPAANAGSAGLEARIRAFVTAHDWDLQDLELLAGDVSTRRYFRISDRHRTAIVAAYPQADWSTADRFVRSGELLGDAGIRVPAVLAADAERRLMLLEDLGSTCYEVALEHPINTERVFRAGAEMIPRIAALDLRGESTLLPPLDAEVLDTEMQAAAAALEKLRQSGGGRQQVRELLNGVRRTLQVHLAGMPLATAHRDLMVRNLVPLPDGSLGVLDHQDLRPAPLGYDLASLMNDSLFPPSELVDELRRRWVPDLNGDDYHRLAAQRTLKATGTYVRALADGNDIHRRLIAPTLERFTDHLAALPELAESATRLRELWPDAANIEQLDPAVLD